ncbi:MAG: hypothetical protein L6Q57_02125 [Alphaproteobacteria bacterium]|nr:hypothetical protein [Alphaproteobacteria bacterium]
MIGRKRQSKQPDFSGLSGAFFSIATGKVWFMECYKPGTLGHRFNRDFAPNIPMDEIDWDITTDIARIDAVSLAKVWPDLQVQYALLFPSRRVNMGQASLIDAICKHSAEPL